MIRITFIEFILRAIPEEFLFVLAAYAFSKKVIDVKRYLLSSILLATIVYLFRFLPIQHLVDTILNILTFILLSVIINRLHIVKAIKACIITTIIEFICEGINFYIIKFIMKKDISNIFNNPLLKILYMSPSVLILGCIVIPCYIRLTKELKNA